MKERQRVQAAALAGVLVLVILVIVIAVVSGGPKPEAGTTRVTSKPAPVTSSASRTPTPTPTPTPTVPPTPFDAAVEAVICVGRDGNSKTFTTIQQVWAENPPREGQCNVRVTKGGTLTEIQKQAMQDAYGDANGSEYALASLYSICTTAASMSPESTNVVDTRKVAAALILCPDHPSADTIRSDIEARDAIASGDQVSDGHYLVGTDVQPGTWQSVGAKVTDCYWEISDAQGNIIANNFISVAPQFTVDIPVGAAGFTVQGCTFRRLA